MNKFLDELKYNVNNVAHKAKKGLLVGGLSLLAASSFVGCSKSSTDNSDAVKQEQSDKKELEKNFNHISSTAEKLLTKLEDLDSYSELSNEDYSEIANFLLDYTFAKTSQDYDGVIPANSIIPNMVNGKLDGTFRFHEDDEMEYFQFWENSNHNPYLNAESVQLYNSFPDDAYVNDALYYIYTVKADLIEINPELLDELSSDDMLNLIKSSYVSAYMNRNPNSEYIKATNTNANFELLNADKNIYDVSWTYSPNNSESISLGTTTNSSGTDLVDDYKDVCTKWYINDSNSSVLDNLKKANQKNEVTTQQIVSQVVDINIEKAQEEQKKQTEHSSEENEITR